MASLQESFSFLVTSVVDWTMWPTRSHTFSFRLWLVRTTAESFSCSVLSLAVAIFIRVVQRLDASSVYGTGTPTNELMRHLLLLVVLQNAFDLDITLYLVAVFAVNALTMLVPFSLPHLIRARTKTVVAILGVNVVLAAAWLTPEAAPFIAAAFFGTYLYSLGVGSVSWARMAR